MNRNIIRSKMAGLMVGAGCFLLPIIVSAENTPPQINEECAKELLLSYFPQQIVTETLKKFDVPQDKWAGITKSLSAKDKEVVTTVEKKAAEMNPNPLKDPQQRQAAVKLFRETLLQVFTDSMKENGIEDTSKFQAMLDDIQQQKAKKFAMCMEKHKSQPKQQNKPEPQDDSQSPQLSDATNEAQPQLNGSATIQAVPNQPRSGYDTDLDKNFDKSADDNENLYDKSADKSADVSNKNNDKTLDTDLDKSHDVDNSTNDKKLDEEAYNDESDDDEDDPEGW